MVKLERLGERLRELRYLRGLTQAQLAYKAGVGEKTLKRLEGGQTELPRPETLAALAGALGVETQALVGGGEHETPVPPATHQLPRPPQSFTARRAELALLETQVLERDAQIVSVHGMGGIGKTSLVLVLAERLTERYPEGQIYLDLRGTTDPLSPSETMLHVIRSLDPGRPAPKTAVDVAASYRTVLRGKRVLLFFDNGATREQVEPLLPPVGCLLLLTSRQRFALHGAVSITLAPLDATDACSLIDTLAPRASVVGDRLASLCGGLPLALSLVGRALAERPDLDPGEYAARLADDASRLSHLDAAQESGGVEASVELSFAMLDEELRTALCALAVFPQHFDRMAAGKVWAADAAETDRRVGRLVRLHLLESDGTGTAARYRLHDLVRLFLDARLPEAQRVEASLRHAEHFLEVLAAVDEDLRSGKAPLAALASIDREWESLRAAVAFCRAHAAKGEASARDRASELCLRLQAAATVLRLRLHPAERIVWYENAAAIARARGDGLVEGALLAQLGRSHQDLGDAKRARSLCEASLSLAATHGDKATEAHAWVALGDAHHALGEARAAIDAAERGLALAQAHGAPAEEAGAQVVLGWAYHVLGELDAAIEHAEQGLPIARELGDRSLEGMALLLLSFAQRGRGDDARCRELGERSLEIARALGDRRMEGYSLLALSQLIVPLDGAAARDGQRASHSLALEIARETGDRRMEGHALVMEGASLNARGQTLSAIAQLEQAVAIADETGDRAMLGNALSMLGVAYTIASDLVRAVERLERAERTLAAMGNRRQEAFAAWLLGCALELRGEEPRAVEAMERVAAYQAEADHPGLEQTRSRIEVIVRRMARLRREHKSRSPS